MKQLIKNYLNVLQTICLTQDDGMLLTPYAFEMKRQEYHKKIWDELVKGLLFNEGFSIYDGYLRSKEIFSRLDKVFALYNDFPLDLQDDECLMILTDNLEKFLSKSEVRCYLEGRIEGIHKVIEKNSRYEND